MTGHIVTPESAKALREAAGVEGRMTLGRMFWKKVPEQFWIQVEDDCGTRAVIPDVDQDPADRALGELFAAAPDLAYTVEQQGQQIAALRAFAEDWVRRDLADWLDPPRRCDLTATDGYGRCPQAAIGVRWEEGFPDWVCEHHAETAEERGALVVYPAARALGVAR